MRSCYVFDIDGTLADLSHRLHMIKRPSGVHDGGPKPDYEAFYDAMVHDRPIWPVIQTAQALAVHHPLVMVTGRREGWREETTEWLAQFDLFPEELHMRANGDRRPDYIFKEEVWHKHLKPRGVIGVFEDRARVVEMWRGLGVPAFQVAEGDY